jgi:hypothetical protein
VFSGTPVPVTERPWQPVARVEPAGDQLSFMEEEPVSSKYVSEQFELPNGRIGYDNKELAVCDTCGLEVRSDKWRLDAGVYPSGWTKSEHPKKDLYIKKPGESAYEPMPEGWTGKRYLYAYTLMLAHCPECTAKGLNHGS